MAKEKTLEQRTIGSIIWKTMERFGVYIIQFVVSIILARLLMPEDYGAIALLTVFIQIGTVFVRSGFSNALIRKLDADEIDYSTVFYTSLIIGVVIYIILFFTAPFIAEFYEQPILSDALRVLALIPAIGAYNSIQNVILQKKLLFKKVFINSIFGTFVSAGVGIGMAYGGFGIWALVAQQLTMIVATSIIMTFTVRWRPRLLFSFKRLKTMFSFGWKLLLSGLINSIYNNVYSLIIGKQYSSADLAYWNRGQQFPSAIVDNVNGSISAVLYPVLSMKQNDKPAMKSIMRKSLQITNYLIFPLMVGLAICAEPLVRLILTDKWLDCVFYLQIWCICYSFMPIAVTNLQAYNALGRSDIFLGLEIAKKIIGIIVLFATLPFGLNWMILGKLITTAFSVFINAFPNKKLLNYGYLQQMKDLLPYAIMALAMGGLIFGLSYLPIHYVGILALQVVLGMIVYVLISAIFKPKAFVFLWGKIRPSLFKILKKVGIKINMAKYQVYTRTSDVSIENDDIMHCEDNNQSIQTDIDMDKCEDNANFIMDSDFELSSENATEIIDACDIEIESDIIDIQEMKKTSEKEMKKTDEQLNDKGEW